MDMADLGRMRFAYSPLTEIGESLYVLASGRVDPFHRAWAERTRPRLGGVDMDLLHAVVPARASMADFFFLGVTDTATPVDAQLQSVAELCPDYLGSELRAVWHGDPLPSAARRLLRDGAAAPRRLADALAAYWRVAVEPHWPRIRAVLDDDVAYRAGVVTGRGTDALFADLHPHVEVRDGELRIQKGCTAEEGLDGTGLVLVPSVFVWPNVIFGTCRPTTPSLTYAARDVANLWTEDTEPPRHEDVLAALLGRGRAAILRYLAVPHSTTELALEIGQSPPSVSQHLAVLRRAGLVTSWRSGRSMLNRRTTLAASVVQAADGTGVASVQ